MAHSLRCQTHLASRKEVHPSQGDAWRALTSSFGVLFCSMFTIAIGNPNCCLICFFLIGQRDLEQDRIFQKFSLIFLMYSFFFFNNWTHSGRLVLPKVTFRNVCTYCSTLERDSGWAWVREGHHGDPWLEGQGCGKAMARTGRRGHCGLHCLMLIGAVWLRKQREPHGFLLERTWAVLNKECPTEEPRC